jgi:proline racemase/trans-L-3-hydroxyproline dehydratase
VARGLVIPTSRGPVEVHVSYGGAFYASVDTRMLGLDVSPARLPELIALQRELRPAIERAIDVVHPDEPELRGIYGVIYWQDERTTASDRTAGVVLTQRNVTVFADGEVDRSPCGSGTSARLALLAADGRLGTTAGGALRHLSVVDTAFLGHVVGQASVADRPAVVTEIEGSAYLTGRHEFILDPRDPLGTGFLLR